MLKNIIMKGLIVAAIYITAIALILFGADRITRLNSTSKISNDNHSISLSFNK